VRYVEWPPLPALVGLVQAVWTLDADDDAKAVVEHRATPDGCLEIIRRLRGRSRWRRNQPACFVAGVIDRPATLRFSGDASFIGLRLWPWTWQALGGRPCSTFLNDWRPFGEAMPAGAARSTLGDLGPDVQTALVPLLIASETHELRVLGRAILGARTVGEISVVTRRPLRWVQRWFAAHVGVPPRTYLRLLRFQDAMRATQHTRGTLADHAADAGFADQAHMAREFRRLAGTPPNLARRKAHGPFL
jgi:AraC-like DNA-binding protein